jgi:hypothetical protein
MNFQDLPIGSMFVIKDSDGIVEQSVLWSDRFYYKVNQNYFFEDSLLHGGLGEQHSVHLNDCIIIDYLTPGEETIKYCEYGSCAA